MQQVSSSVTVTRTIYLKKACFARFYCQHVFFKKKLLYFEKRTRFLNVIFFSKSTSEITYYYKSRNVVGFLLSVAVGLQLTPGMGCIQATETSYFDTNAV